MLEGGDSHKCRTRAVRHNLEFSQQKTHHFKEKYLTPMSQYSMIYEV